MGTLRRAGFVLALLAGLCSRAEELGEAPSLQGFTGALNTPTAWTQREGTFHLLFTPQEDPRFRATAPVVVDNPTRPTTTYAIGASPLRFLEAAARLTEAPGCCRDLSLNAKLQLPLQLIWPALPLALAGGVQDFGGAVPHFRSNYLVASARWRMVAGSVGYGTGPDRMRGWFGSAQVRPVEWAEALGEYDGTDWSAGMRLSVPFTAGASHYSASFIAKTAFTHNPGVVEWGAAVSGDLSFGTQGLEASVTGAARRPMPSQLRSAGEVEASLVAMGFESVRVAIDGTVLAVEYENNVFLHAEMDGLGVGLGILASAAIEGVDAIAVTLTRRGIPLIEVRAPAASVREFYARTTKPGVEPLASAAQIVVRPSRRAALAQAAIANASSWRVQATAHPSFRPLIGNEYTNLEAVFAVRPEVIAGLWSGATLYARWDIPLAWTRAYADRGPLQRYRGYPKLDFGLLHQAFPVAERVTVAAAAGFFRHDSAGALGEVLWTPGDGAHAFGVQAAWTQSITGERHPSLTGSWRYFLPSLAGQLLVRGGQFYEGDRGVTIEASRFFGDVQVGAFYTRATFSTLGAVISMPLMPRESMKPGLVQLRGPRRWAMTISTTVHEANVNPQRSGIGVVPLAPLNVDATYLDAGRLTAGAVRTGFPQGRRAFELVVQSRDLDQGSN